MEYHLQTLEEFEQNATSFCKELFPHKQATIVLLSGDLGAGKTTFVQKCAQYFGITEPLTSPTFVIQKEYDINNHPFFNRLIHIDAYRLEGKHDLEYLGWNTLIEKSENIIFLEWPEKVAGISAPDRFHISITLEEGEQRRLSLKK